MDKAFGRASKITKEDRDKGHRARKTTLARFEAVRNILDDTLYRYVAKFPSLDQLPPYYQELIRLLITEDRYRMALGGVDRARHNIIKILNRAMQQVRHETDGDVLDKARRQTYGRVSSLLKDIEKPLSELADFRKTIKRFPGLRPGLFTVVIAGHPNVGKSSIIRVLSKAEPEVASYPFTTKAANVGHMVIDRPGRRWSESRVEIQLIDTPGLLDRPASERNAIEHQAALALKHLADMILYVRDPTGHCGYPVEAQDRLLAEVRETVPGVPLIVVESKADIKRTEREDVDLRVSTKTLDGIPDLTESLVNTVTTKPANPELEAFLRGEEMPSGR